MSKVFKICFHIPHALFGSLSAKTRYHGAIARSFLKLTGSNFLKHLLVLIFGVDLGRLIFLFFFYLHRRDNDHLSKGQIPHYGKRFEDHLLEKSQYCIYPGASGFCGQVARHLHHSLRV